jgi:hypothetical protein
MNDMRRIVSEIVEVTSKIESLYPELYQFLEENPETIPSQLHPNIDKSVLEEYLDSLKQLLQHYMQTHNGKQIIT